MKLKSTRVKHLNLNWTLINFTKMIMKKIKLLFVGVVLAAFSASAQPIFSEDFSGTTPLSTWTLHNVDARTQAANVGAINDAWVVLGVGGQPAALV